jgi:HK97 family phage portal protein
MFLTNLQASTSDRDPTDDFWFQPGAALGGTKSGAVVTADTAMRLSTVYKVINVISQTMGTLSAHMYRMANGQQRDRVRDDPVARIFSTRPNEWQTPMQFRQMLEAHRSLRGNGYARIYWGDDGKPEAMVPLHPDRVTVEVGENGLPRYKVQAANGARAETLLPGEMFHLVGLSLDGFVGINPIQAEREAIGSAIAARDFGSRFWNNDARPPFYIKVPQPFKDNEARKNFRNEWQASYGGANHGRPAVLDRGMEIAELGVNNTDSQWLDFRKYSEVDICGLWRMPPHKIGIMDRATWANVEHMNIEFVTDCVLPLAVSWEQTIARDMIVDEEQFIELLLEVLLRGDTATRYEAYGKAIKDGWMTRNEARQLENRNPLPGLDEPLQPLNMATAGAAMLPRGGAGRAAALLGAAAARIARKEVGILQTAAKTGQPLHAAFTGHDRFVAEVLAVPIRAAEGYVAEALQRAGAMQLTPELDAQGWINGQVAALMRLEG